MGKPRRVLITGIAGALAGQLAQRLEADDRVGYIAGVDLREPAQALAGTEFVRADLRSPLVSKLVESMNVDTIVHLAITSAPAGAGGRSRMKERNVIGTMQLLAAAQSAPALRRVVVKSTTAVYGSSHGDPALFREDAEPGPTPHSGYSKDAVEVEGYARAFARRREDVGVTILRFANFVGPGVDSPLTRYFSLPVVPTVLGYDPRLQLVHISDAIAVLERVISGADAPVHGTYNVAGPGILYLSQAIRRAGKPFVSVPLPLVNTVADAVRRTGRVDFTPEQLRFLLYGRVGDITRLRTVLGYEPAYWTAAAFDELLAAGGVTPLVGRETAQAWERALGALARRAVALVGSRS